MSDSEQDDPVSEQPGSGPVVAMDDIEDREVDSIEDGGEEE